MGVDDQREVGTSVRAARCTCIIATEPNNKYTKLNTFCPFLFSGLWNILGFTQVTLL